MLIKAALSVRNVELKKKSAYVTPLVEVGVVYFDQSLGAAHSKRW